MCELCKIRIYLFALFFSCLFTVLYNIRILWKKRNAVFGDLATSDNGMIHRPRNNAAYTASLVEIYNSTDASCLSCVGKS